MDRRVKQNSLDRLIDYGILSTVFFAPLSDVLVSISLIVSSIGWFCKRSKFIKTKLDIPIYTFILIGIISSILSQDFLNISNFLTFFLAYFLITNNVRTCIQRERIIKMIAISAGSLSILGLLNPNNQMGDFLILVLPLILIFLFRYKWFIICAGLSIIYLGIGYKNKPTQILWFKDQGILLMVAFSWIMLRFFHFSLAHIKKERSILVIGTSLGIAAFLINSLIFEDTSLVPFWLIIGLNMSAIPLSFRENIIEATLLRLVTKFVGWLAQVLPEHVCFFLGMRFVDLLYFLAGLTRYRNYVINNIRLAFKDEYTIRELHVISKNHLYNLVKAIVELLRFPLLNKENITKYVTEVKGLEHLDKALAKGKGVILVTGHFGNWELISAYLSLNGYKVNVLVQRQSKRTFDDLFNRSREGVGTRVIYNRDNPRTLLRLLKRNEILGILADQHGESKRVITPFFSQNVSVPPGPVIFARKTQASLIPIFIIRKRDDKHRIEILPEIEIRHTECKDKDLELNSSEWMGILEDYIRRYPDHWLWVYNRWDKLSKG
ncbi:MAG: lysophospholipid acyltransferase family protein [bacterium]|nr:lysophospholipid acyltransferase family protein [bacterium]